MTGIGQLVLLSFVPRKFILPKTPFFRPEMKVISLLHELHAVLCLKLMISISQCKL